MTLEELTAGLDVRVPPGADRVRICDLTEDSRTVVPGSLFVARKGTKTDGKAYLLQALEAGAVAVLTDDPGLTAPAGHDEPIMYASDVERACGLIAERFYGSAASKLRLVGVTGTNGKTTTTFLVWQLLNGSGLRCGLVGTVLVDDGVEVAPASMTTPPAIEISRSLSMMLEAGCQAAALEVSSHALDQKRADALPFAVAVFTNLTGDHLDYHKTMEDYGAAKARLFEGLAPGATAVVNARDRATARMLRDCKAGVLRCAVTTRGAPPGDADCVAEVLEESTAGMLLKLTGPWGSVQELVPLIGRYNAMNVLQAAAACHVVGLPARDLARGLGRLTAPPGRLERVTQPGDPISVFVDYAHSDDSLKNVLSAVGAVMPGRRGASGLVHGAAGAPFERPEGGKLWVVFGCGGERDKTKRPRMGLAAATLADHVIITNDNPRSETPSEIVDEIMAGVPTELRGNLIVQIDRAKAIRAAIEGAAPGDVVVIAGKGHETEQILPDGKGGKISTHFDDREVARAVLDQTRPAGKPAREAKGGHARGQKRWARGMPG